MNGRRVTVPALHLHGSFADGPRRTEWESWVLADSVHPLLLKSVIGDDVFQMVRADLPMDLPTPGGTLPDGTVLERELDASCRLELPGVCFAFGTATVDPISDRALAQVARILARHRDWSFTVEGHTDSVGTAATIEGRARNRRVELVRACR